MGINSTCGSIEPFLPAMRSGIFSGRGASPAALPTGLRKYSQEGALPSLTASSSQAKALLLSLSASGLNAEALLLSSALRHHRLLREQRAASRPPPNNQSTSPSPATSSSSSSPTTPNPSPSPSSSTPLTSFPPSSSGVPKPCSPHGCSLNSFEEEGQ